MNHKPQNNDEHPMRILVIEDNRGDALLIKRAFERIQTEFEMTIAKTGEEALHSLQLLITQSITHIPDIILLDLNLPGVNGLDVLRTLKSDLQLKHIPVIILSSSRAKLDVDNCYKSHANCYVQKAGSIEELYRFAHTIEQFWFKTVVLPNRINRKTDNHII